MKKVLVLDDDPEIVNHLVKKLNENGYFSIPCYESYEAIKKAHKELPDLVITDYSLSGSNGINFCKGLKASDITKSIPVMFITAYPLDRVRREAMDLGAVDFMVKPFDTAKLLKRISEILNKTK
ncbi:MAG: response regulator [Endomicrobiales bacterium]|nr:response regulator [Endomicrobiales bacterium]